MLLDSYRISMALTGHEPTASSQSQVWHWSGPITHDLSSRSSNTAGHNSAHTPQPIHRSWSTVGIAMIFSFIM
jgi:hypothetical protein